MLRRESETPWCGKWVMSAASGRKLSVMLNLNQNGDYNAQYPNIGSVYQTEQHR